MNVFITGIAGFLGSHLADAFLARGCRVTGIDTLLGGYRDNVPHGADFVEADCNDFERVRMLMSCSDVVYHCAATAYEGLSVFSPHIVTQHIVTATTGVVSAAIQNRVKRFVLCSSMARYGAQPVPFVEDMASMPQDPYGIGKVAAENLLKNLAETHGMEWAIAVPHNIIGPRQKYDDPYRNVAAIFINRMLQGKQPYIYGDGGQKRCFSFISDVVRPLVRLAEDPDCNGQIFNVGPDSEFVTILELAETVAEIVGLSLAPICIDPRPQEVRLANCSADKARRMLGYEPAVSLRDGIEEMVRWVEARGPRPFEYHLPIEIVSEKTPRTWKEKLL